MTIHRPLAYKADTVSRYWSDGTASGSFIIRFSYLSEEDLEYMQNAIDLMLDQAEHDRGFNDGND